MLLWCSAVASIAAVVWYSYELRNNGYVSFSLCLPYLVCVCVCVCVLFYLVWSRCLTIDSYLLLVCCTICTVYKYILYIQFRTDPHLIAWFSAGAFVLLGFPISIYGIVSHLANYNEPNVQCYVVRILWMVPIYSIESWLAMRYKDYAIYIETLRDCYEAYVLYSFLQFLIEVLGGEEALILMLKDKSPTRGVHMWGLQWCVKPWLMGQPVRKTYEDPTNDVAMTATTTTATTTTATTTTTNNNDRRFKRVHWTSPFFVFCKFGVLQYVLLKYVCTFAVLILERNKLYKEGDFTPKGGYLYICILTNLSQCWALYCLIFFYYATKNELGPIRPVGKFVAVKALVFFTWWQSVGISMLYQMDLIPEYISSSSPAAAADAALAGDASSLLLSFEDALALDEFGGNAVLSDPSILGEGASLDAGSSSMEWTPEDVAKAFQDYLICIEMFLAAILHIFVFSHTEYDPKAVEARARALNRSPNKDWNKRVGRKWKEWDNKSNWSAASWASRSRDDSSTGDLELQVTKSEDDDLLIHPMDRTSTSDKPSLDEADEEIGSVGATERDDDEEYSSGSEDASSFDDEEQELLPAVQEEVVPKPVRKKGFVSALLDSTIPQDLREDTVGIIKGDYLVERKTLLHHAATSDSYDLFSRAPKRKWANTRRVAATKEKTVEGGETA